MIPASSPSSRSSSKMIPTPGRRSIGVTSPNPAAATAIWISWAAFHSPVMCIFTKSLAVTRKSINVFENWSLGDTYISAIGQGYVLSTPLQVLVSAATLANDGKLMRPTLIKEVIDNQGNVIKPFEPDMLWDITKDPKIHVYDENFFQTDELKVVEPWVVDKVKEGMREVVVSGTGAKVFEGAPFESAGKTGTAEYCDDVARPLGICIPGSWPAHPWEIGYAPHDKHEI